MSGAEAFLEEGIIFVVRGPGAYLPRIYEDAVRMWRRDEILSTDGFQYAADRERLIDEARD